MEVLRSGDTATPFSIALRYVREKSSPRSGAYVVGRVERKSLVISVLGVEQD